MRHNQIIFCTMILFVVLYAYGCATAPKIVSAPKTSAILYDDYRDKVLSEGTQPVEFKKISGPDDLVVDSISGVVTWHPIKEDKYQVKIQAINKAGSDSKEYIIVVSADENYKNGFEFGIKLRKEYDKSLLDETDDYIIYKLIRFSINEKPNKFDIRLFKRGFFEGFSKDAIGKETDKQLNDVINLLFQAMLETDIFDSGFSAGDKLRNEKISIFDIREAKHRSIILGSAKALAWKAGFVCGYSEPNKDAEPKALEKIPLHYAVRIYLALPE